MVQENIDVQPGRCRKKYVDSVWGLYISKLEKYDKVMCMIVTKIFSQRRR